jgi:hypothetical protein
MVVDYCNPTFSEDRVKRIMSWKTAQRKTLSNKIKSKGLRA